MTLRLAITGGTGFVGHHVLAAARQRGHRVQALTRRPQPPMAGIDWINGDMADMAALRRLAEGADAVVHIAGATNAPSRAGFVSANVDAVHNLRAAIGATPLVHVSSLAARLPARSTYGWSKRLGEEIARRHEGPMVAVRPPAVYGPGDTEFLALIRLARTGRVAFPKGARTAMLYAADLAAALLALAEDLTGAARARGQVYEIDDGAGAHSPEQIAAAIGLALGRRVQAVRVPPQLLPAAAIVDSVVARLRGVSPHLSRDRARYMAHPDWSADSSALLALGIWAPEMTLAKGLRATVVWAKRHGLL